MIVNDTAPAKPGLIDRIRDLIAKLFGPPARKPHGTEPAEIEDLANTARPPDATIHATAPGQATTTA